MLLIFGSTVRFKVLATLAFFCPNCRADRQGSRRSARRWYTFFFIPLIPGKELGEVVTCDTCGQSFPPEVEQVPTTATVETARADAQRALGVLVVGAGDATDAQVRAAAVASIGSIVAGYVDATLTTDLAAIDRSLATAYAHPLADDLSLGAKEQFLGGLVRIAAASGAPTPAQRALLDEVGHALGLTPAHVLGIVTSIVGGPPAT